MDRPSQLYDDNTDGVRGNSFAYSAPTRHSSSSHHGGGTRASLIERNIIAAPLDPRAAENTMRSPHKAYKGRLRRWPGVLLLVMIVGGAIAAIAYFSVSKGQEAHDRAFAVQKRLAKERAIADGLTSGSDEVDVDDDGQVNNPKVYPQSSCQQPDYQSKNGKIYAVAKNGTEVSFQIKGVNWFGMETGLRSPFGLWDNEQNGTTVYAIAQFLAKNKFNSVRIPLCVESILNNKAPQLSIINRVTNRALDLTSSPS
ncbi:hypothetical protein SDRG_12190 [Saprolegnia diclina VS20]|uniref:Glycoside hydrolase family 5 domain-containing protein n=1 Tax=Saprolegnia diclina (strain VS20) TaxID=1156394 RepID=T0RJR2_SAPDV|nr:hypothetical protein SDRG_12190 [Saprolegnia diclina VS20]EQC30132.1 hypothetical protein SDRG_12190 [Saprolegnia diclina VS20]|eukprot:XP_008616475.1 hypothetical protein SDRG_12190 [Saprolegnia diclina VS20]